MANVVKGMDKAMESMNLEKVYTSFCVQSFLARFSLTISQISMVMDKFESQFEDLDVQTEYMEGAMAGTTTMTTPQNEVEMLMQQVADEHGLELNQELGQLEPSRVLGEQAKQKEKDEDALLTERLKALRQ